MIMVAAMAAVLWGTGMAMGTPKRARWIMIALLLSLVIVIQIALPDRHPLREATGGDVRLWTLILAFGAIGFVYRRLLQALRQKAGASEHPVETPVKPTSFSETELNRYGRHIMLREVGGVGQKALRDAKILVVGAGGLGSPALQYLAAAGVGQIGVIDDDIVENTNLQRQVIHTDDRIGMPKVHSAAEAIRAQNPFVTVKPYHRRLDDSFAPELFAEYDFVMDGTDNFATRYLVNETCVAGKIPLVAAALTQWEGQISVYDPANDAPCYACIFPHAPAADLVPSCAEAGVIGPLPGVIGSMMAVETIKLITGAGDPLRGRLMIYDALYAETRVITAKRRPDCAVCGAAHLP
ncbi:molybdopterin/thiamine biosynthesis adenylyltransferase [Loktanella ponticola]|uniref:Molybdopterin-synthase adenylyltransferase n=1 Tax=Yoonia ponticola TaxID=1524255 RepID=A0A7W9BH92_9RHOB|nr:molybdopterin-synthase adenylyltransferase MoeB [Yoonia ponticola]MBB5720484.1 molybdopterin/thiamine biosynthesis adenylyltransferase [Yoonia ponticola]